MMPAPFPAQRLARLIPRLGSDAEGEVLATVAAIRRQLAAAGMDLHDLVALVERGAATPSPPPDLAPASSPAELAADLLATAATWSPREASFLRSMVRIGRRDWSALTPRQSNWLRDLAAEGRGAA